MVDTDNKITIKEYDTVAIWCEYQEDDGTPLSLDGVKIYAAMRQMYLDEHVDFTVNRQPETGHFILNSSVEFIPRGLYFIDVLFENELTGCRIASDTFELLVKPAISKPLGA